MQKDPCDSTNTETDCNECKIVQPDRCWAKCVSSNERCKRSANTPAPGTLGIRLNKPIFCKQHSLVRFPVTLIRVRKCSNCENNTYAAFTPPENEKNEPMPVCKTCMQLPRWIDKKFYQEQFYTQPNPDDKRKNSKPSYDRSTSETRVYETCYICQICFTINPNKGENKCSFCKHVHGENTSLRRNVYKEDVINCGYRDEEQKHKWGLKHALNNLMRKHLLFVPQPNENEEKMDEMPRNRESVFPACKQTSEQHDVIEPCTNSVLDAHPHTVFQFAERFDCNAELVFEMSDDTTPLDMAENAKKSAFKNAMNQLKIHTIHPFFKGIVLRINFEYDDDTEKFTTQHYTCIRKAKGTSNSFEYIESHQRQRDLGEGKLTPEYTQTLSYTNATAITEFLQKASMRNRILSIYSITSKYNFA